MFSCIFRGLKDASVFEDYLRYNSALLLRSIYVVDS